MPDLANRPFEDPCLPVGFQDTFFVNGHSYQLIGTGPHIADIVLQKKSIFIKQIVVNIHHRMTMITSKDLVQQDGKLLQICVIKRLQRTWWRNLLAANCP